VATRLESSNTFSVCFTSPSSTSVYSHSCTFSKTDIFSAEDMLTVMNSRFNEQNRDFVT
jgi:hypothetical protein